MLLKKRKRLIIAIVILVGAFGFWWWRWQAPYRTLNAFLQALYAGDVKTLYALTPAYERKYGAITPELVERTYRLLIKPHLLERYHHLIRIDRVSASGPMPEIWLKSREVPFHLWFRSAKGEIKATKVSVVYPPDNRGWKVPFSYFVFKTCISLYGVERVDGIMLRLGYKLVAGPLGDAFWLIK